MGPHPLNLTLRFALELAALFAAGLWGWQQREDGLRFALAIGLPLLLAVAWGCSPSLATPAARAKPRFLSPVCCAW